MFGCDWLTDFKKSECCAPVNISCECRAFLGQSAVRFGKKVRSRYKQVVPSVKSVIWEKKRAQQTQILSKIIFAKFGIWEKIF